MKGKKYAGFSLIEILVVVALMVILATITIVAINPAKNFRDTRDAQRSADVLQILNAVTQYTSEEGHTLADLGTISTCPTETCIGTGTACVDLAGDGTNKLVEEYIVEIPMDPSERDATDTGYSICQTVSGRVQISATPETQGKTIVVKR